MKTTPIHISKHLETTQNLRFDAFAKKEFHIVSNAEEFKKMQNFIVGKYTRLNIKHSFSDFTGQVWDCIPIEEQVSLKKSGKLLASPPKLPHSRANEVKGTQSAIQSFGEEKEDEYGNERRCPEGHIPVRRITLNEMCRFKKFEDYFKKGPGGAGRFPFEKTANDAEVTHKYAAADQEGIDNMGGSSYLNIWRPYIDVDQDYAFSLSQQWFAAGKQTVECGWHVYPQLYGNNFANLFIYWTPDGYQSGCHNLVCDAFIQTSSDYCLGAPWFPVSTVDGDQIEAAYAFFLSEGNWWLFIQNVAIGYYPASIFEGGPLPKNATKIIFGGETIGINSWPAMGSGEFASEGPGKAAYQRNVRYFPPNAPTSEKPELNSYQPSERCYTIDLSDKGDMGVHFFFGGPGGTGC